MRGDMGQVIFFWPIAVAARGGGRVLLIAIEAARRGSCRRSRGDRFDRRHARFIQGSRSCWDWEDETLHELLV
jgi:hypothetical protein